MLLTECSCPKNRIEVALLPPSLPGVAGRGYRFSAELPLKTLSQKILSEAALGLNLSITLNH